MQRPSDELIVAYLDGEVDERCRAEIVARIDADPGLRDRVAQLQESAALLRAAYDDVLHEPLPERLIAAARGETRPGAAAAAALMAFPAPRIERLRRFLGPRRRWVGVAAAASLFGLVIGTGVGFFVAGEPPFDSEQAASATQPANGWLDSIAGYHKLFVNAGANDVGLVDVPPSSGNGEATRKVTQRLPQDFRLPNLKPWGLVFQGARFLIVEGRPATQLFYTTDNKALGPLTIVIGSSSKPDMAPTFDHRDDVNMLYWRHHGHTYALVGTADIGYLWNLANDIAWQLDAI